MPLPEPGDWVLYILRTTSRPNIENNTKSRTFWPANKCLKEKAKTSMPSRIKIQRKRRRVVFMTDASSPSRSVHQSTYTDLENVSSGELDQNDRRDPENSWELIDETESDLSSDMDVEMRGPVIEAQTHPPPVPELFTTLPPIRDALRTETSSVQDRTVQDCLPYLSGTKDSSKSPFDFNAHGLPRLEREKHIAYLHGSLGKLPAGFVGADASRPWLLYWALTGLYLLGEDVSRYRDR